MHHSLKKIYLKGYALTESLHVRLKKLEYSEQVQSFPIFSKGEAR